MPEKTIQQRANDAEAALWDYRPMLSNFAQQVYYREEIEQALADLVCDAAHLLAKLGEAEPVGRLTLRLSTALEANYEAEVHGE